MSPEAHARLVELDEVSRASREFYEYAAALLPASTLRERCQRLALAKQELVALLALRLPLATLHDAHAATTPRPAPDWVDNLDRGLGRARVGLATPDPGRLWDELQRLEIAVTDACRRQVGATDDADCARELAWLLPLLERCRDEFALR